MAQERTCSANCQSFKCSKNSAVYRQKEVWCQWTEENCDIADCTYALCLKRRLLPQGVCGETVKRKTVDKEPEEIIKPAVKLRGRILRKIGDKEVY